MRGHIIQVTDDDGNDLLINSLDISVVESDCFVTKITMRTAGANRKPRVIVVSNWYREEVWNAVKSHSKRRKEEW